MLFWVVVEEEVEYCECCIWCGGCMEVVEDVGVFFG